MKTITTLAIALFMFVTANTVFAQTAPKFSNETVITTVNNVITEKAYQTQHILSDGRKVIIRLIMPTSKESNQLVTAVEDQNGCNTSETKNVDIPKSFANIKINKADNNVSVSYEDMLLEKNVNVELALAQK